MCMASSPPLSRLPDIFVQSSHLSNVRFHSDHPFPGIWCSKRQDAVLDSDYPRLARLNKLLDRGRSYSHWLPYKMLNWMLGVAQLPRTQELVSSRHWW